MPPTETSVLPAHAPPVSQTAETTDGRAGPAASGPTEGSPTHRVLLCVAASVIFHVVLSVALPALRGLAPARVVSQAHAAMGMFEEAIPIDVPAVEPEVTPPPAPEPEPTPVRRRAATPAPAQVPVPNEVAPEPTSNPDPEPAATASAVPAAASTVGTSTEGGLRVAARQGSGAVSAGRSTAASAPVTRQAPAVDHRGLYRSYRSLITRRVRPLARYPRVARSAGIEGVVVVALRVDRRGNVIGRSIARSSGNASLDRAAMEGTAGLRIPAPPDGLLSMWNDAQVIRVRVPFVL